MSNDIKLLGFAHCSLYISIQLIAYLYYFLKKHIIVQILASLEGRTDNANMLTTRIMYHVYCMRIFIPVN